MSVNNPRNAGRKPVEDDQMRRETISLRLPRWLINKMDQQTKTTRTALVEEALCEKHGWKPDNDNGNNY